MIEHITFIKNKALHIENDDWAENKTKDNTIQLHILNRSFTYTIDTKKICPHKLIEYT